MLSKFILDLSDLHKQDKKLKFCLRLMNKDLEKKIKNLFSDVDAIVKYRSNIQINGDLIYLNLNVQVVSYEDGVDEYVINKPFFKLDKLQNGIDNKTVISNAKQCLFLTVLSIITNKSVEDVANVINEHNELFVDIIDSDLSFSEIMKKYFPKNSGISFVYQEDFEQI